MGSLILTIYQMILKYPLNGGSNGISTLLPPNGQQEKLKHTVQEAQLCWSELCIQFFTAILPDFWGNPVYQGKILTF